MKKLTLIPLAALSLAIPLVGCTANDHGSAGEKSHTMKKAAPAVKEYAAPKSVSYDRPGFTVIEEDGRLWVFRDGSEELAQFKEHGEPAKIVVLPAAGPDRKTLKGTDRDTMMEYALTRTGFTVSMDDGRLWVFLDGSEALQQFQEHGEPAKVVVRPGAGPRGITLKSVDAMVLDAYMAAQ